MLQIGRSLVRSQPVSLEFFIHTKSFRSHYGPGVGSSFNRNEYQEQHGRCVKLTALPPSSAVVMKSGNLNFLEPSGPMQACNETALTFSIGTSSAAFQTHVRLPFSGPIRYEFAVHCMAQVSRSDYERRVWDVCQWFVPCTNGHR